MLGVTKCVLIDDIISSGVNMSSSINYLTMLGFDVTGVMSVVYRGGGAKEKAKVMGIPFDYLYEIPEEVI
jgi:orotate phosphoribosyltransferase